MARDIGIVLKLWEEGFHMKVLTLPIKKICHRLQKLPVIDSIIWLHVHKRGIYCDREQNDCQSLGVEGNDRRQRSSIR